MTIDLHITLHVALAPALDPRLDALLALLPTTFPAVIPETGGADREQGMDAMTTVASAGPPRVAAAAFARKRAAKSPWRPEMVAMLNERFAAGDSIPTITNALNEAHGVTVTEKAVKMFARKTGLRRPAAGARPAKRAPVNADAVAVSPQIALQWATDNKVPLPAERRLAAINAARVAACLPPFAIQRGPLDASIAARAPSKPNGAEHRP